MKPWVTLDLFYALMGAMFGYMAVSVAFDRRRARRWGAALFWGGLAAIYLFGQNLPPAAVGYLVVGLVTLAGLRLVHGAEPCRADRAERAAAADQWRNRLFWPLLLVPVATAGGAFALRLFPAANLGWLDTRQSPLILLGTAAVLATVVAVFTTGGGWRVPAGEGSRLLQAVGWALVLPQMLAVLGAIFSRAGVGSVVAELVGRALPTHYPFVAVAAYCLGMAAFTMCLGNAFAAFAVVTGGIGLPFIVHQNHGNPAIMASLGMLSGYCGTLMTPLAANFNIVPALLLELEDRNAVVKAQLPIGASILAANIAIMYGCVYRY
jgi:uncharacterized membrane protein